MARIQPPPHLALWIRVLFAVCRWRYGRVHRPLQIAAHAPQFMLPFLMMSGFAHRRGTLPQTTRLLAMHLVAELNRCDWCRDFGRSLGAAEIREKLEHVRAFDTHPLFTDAERAALRYAYEASQVPIAVSTPTFDALRRHFSDRQIVELTASIAAESLFNRMNAPLDIEAEGFCPLPSIATESPAELSAS